MGAATPSAAAFPNAVFFQPRLDTTVPVVLFTMQVHGSPPLPQHKTFTYHSHELYPLNLPHCNYVENRQSTRSNIERTYL